MSSRIYRTMPWLILFMAFGSTGYAANIFVEDFSGTDEEKIEEALQYAQPGDTVFFGKDCVSQPQPTCFKQGYWEIARTIQYKNGVTYTGLSKEGPATLKLINTDWINITRSLRLMSFTDPTKNAVTIEPTHIEYINFDMNRQNQPFNWDTCQNNNQCGSTEACINNYCYPKACQGADCKLNQAAVFASSTPSSHGNEQLFVIRHASFDNSLWKGLNAWHNALVDAKYITTSNNHNGVLIGGHDGNVGINVAHWTSTQDRVAFRGEIEGAQGDPNQTITTYTCADGVTTEHINVLPHGPSWIGPTGFIPSTATVNITNATIIDPKQVAVTFNPKGGDGIGSSFSMSNVTTTCTGNHVCLPHLHFASNYATIDLNQINIGKNDDNFSIKLFNIGNDVSVSNATLAGSIHFTPMALQFAKQHYLDKKCQKPVEYTYSYFPTKSRVDFDTVTFNDSLHYFIQGTLPYAPFYSTPFYSTGRHFKNYGEPIQYTFFDIDFTPPLKPDYLFKMNGGNTVIDVNTRINSSLAPLHITTSTNSTVGYEANVRWERRTCIHPLCVPTNRWMEKSFTQQGLTIFDMTPYDF